MGIRERDGIKIDRSSVASLTPHVREEVTETVRPPSLDIVDQSATILTEDDLKLPAPDRQADGDFSHEGPVWVVSLNDAQTHKLSSVIAAGGGFLGLLSGPLWPAVAAALSTSIGYIETVNNFGGNNGVDINGVIGTTGVIVTPRIGKIYAELIKASRVAVSGRTVMDFVVRASASVPELASALQMPAVASIFSAVAAGTPLGWAVAGGVGLIVNLFSPEPDPNAHGAVLANRDRALAWESFVLGQLGGGNSVALLSWQGFFSAQKGGGHGVYGNRPQVGEWETWTLIDNADGTVSFRTINGHFLWAEEGGGRECQANRTSIGNWEKFVLVNLPDGKIALMTHERNKFVSVQKDS